MESPITSSGDVAQLGERLVRNQKVGGSIPLISTIFTKILFLGIYVSQEFEGKRYKLGICAQFKSGRRT